MCAVLVGLDIGGTKTEAAVAGEDGRVLGRAIVPTNSVHGEGLVETISCAVDEALRAEGLGNVSIAAIGLGIPGQVESQQGIVRLAVNLGVTAFPLGHKLAEKFGGAPIVLENDVRLAALGVYQTLQAAEPVHSLAYISVGTGVAAGIVLDGQIFRGAHGMAGEIGHIIVQPGGRHCNCGLRGCLETVVSGPAIAEQAGFLVYHGQVAGAADVYSAAGSGHPQALALVSQASAYLARAIHGLAMSFDVERIVIGGGVTAAGEAFWLPLAAQLAALRKESALVAAMLPPERITVLPAGLNPGVLGALTLARRAASEALSTVTRP